MTVTIWKGDVLKGLRKLADNSIDCVVCSPPYWGLRDYGVKGQMGLENSLGQHLRDMVAVFEEVKRVLKPSGTCWVNYGDCYATTPNGRSAAEVKKLKTDDRCFRDKPFSTIGPIDKRKRLLSGAGNRWGGGNNPSGGYLKPKDLCMMPNRFAIAMQEAGWWVRSEIIWAKPCPMPESVRDRPATSHEKIFLFTKSPKYYYNAEDSRRPLAEKTLTTYGTKRKDLGNDPGNNVKASNFARTMPTRKPREEKTGVGWRYREDGEREKRDGFNDRWDQMTKTEQRANGRNLRNWEPAYVQVWEIATASFKGAHFATFPPELVERCLTAGCPPGGKVLDPFGGAGTTGMVANQMGMDCHLIELNGDYCKIAWRRIKSESPMLTEIAVENFQPELFPVDN